MKPRNVQIKITLPAELIAWIEEQPGDKSSVIYRLVCNAMEAPQTPTRIEIQTPTLEEASAGFDMWQ